MSNNSIHNLKAIIFDWAGTTIDFGSCAPTEVFRRAFATHGVAITAAQAREPMGRAKWDHIRCIVEIPEVAHKWLAVYGSLANNRDIDAIYDSFMKLQGDSLKDFCKLIDGTVELYQWCIENHLKVGSTTGYVQSQIDVLLEQAASQGYEPSCAIGADHVPVGRPAPFLLYEAAKQLNVYPMNRVVAVDDTPVGVQAGRNAGCWTVGISRTGNEVGLSETELNRLSTQQQAELIASAEHKLVAAGAHFVVESVAQLKPILLQIDQLITNGQMACSFK